MKKQVEEVAKEKTISKNKKRRYSLKIIKNKLT